MSAFYQSAMVIIVSLILAKVWVLAENSIHNRSDLAHTKEELRRLEKQNAYLKQLIDHYHNGGGKPFAMALPVMIPGPLRYERRGHDIILIYHRRLQDD